MLIEKYKPTSLSDIVGQDSAIHDLRNWANSWSKPNKAGKIRPSTKSVFIYGPPGTGKTSSAHALANDFGWEVLEVNASDERNAKEIKRIIGHAIYFKPWNTRTLIIIDEIDSMERGGLRALEDLIEDSVNPIILICNDAYGVNRLTEYFKTNSLQINFKRLRKESLRLIGNLIEKNENIHIDNLDKLVEYGDARYLINNINIPIIQKKTTDNIYSAVHDIFAGKWDGDISDVDLEFVWKVVKYNIYDFYDDIHGMSVAEFLESVDRVMDYTYRNYRGKGSYVYWSFLINILKLMPPHQKSKLIEIPKSFNDVRNGRISEPNITDDIKLLAKVIHCSTSKTYRMLKQFPALKKFALDEKPVVVQNTNNVKSSRTLFEF